MEGSIQPNQPTQTQTHIFIMTVNSNHSSVVVAPTITRNTKSSTIITHDRIPSSCIYIYIYIYLFIYIYLSYERHQLHT